MEFNSRPYLGYNELYMQGKGSYRNAIGYSSEYKGVQVVGEEGGVLGSRAQNQANGAVVPALAWKGGNVTVAGDIIYKGKVLEVPQNQESWVISNAQNSVPYLQPDGLENPNLIGPYQGNVCQIQSPNYNAMLCNECVSRNYTKEKCQKVPHYVTLHKSLSIPDVFVGIGTATPSLSLEVVGNALISGNLTLSGLYGRGVGYLDIDKLARFANTNLTGIVRQAREENFVFNTYSYQQCYDIDGHQRSCFEITVPTYAEQTIYDTESSVQVIGAVHNESVPTTQVSDEWIPEYVVSPDNHTYEGYRRVTYRSNVTGTKVLADTVRIGIANPQAPLHVAGRVLVDSVLQTNKLGIGVSTPLAAFHLKGNALIEGGDLTVHGTLKAKGYYIDYRGIWPDYVFDRKINSEELYKLETYIRTHKHLPGVMSQKEVKENRVDVLNLNKSLLEKTEELTL